MLFRRKKNENIRDDGFDDIYFQIEPLVAGFQSACCCPVKKNNWGSFRLNVDIHINNDKRKSGEKRNKQKNRGGKRRFNGPFPWKPYLYVYSVGIGQFTSLSHYARTFDCRDRNWLRNRRSIRYMYIYFSNVLSTAIRFDRFPFFACVSNDLFFGYLSSFSERKKK